jgi:hypothetical protein
MTLHLRSWTSPADEGEADRDYGDALASELRGIDGGTVCLLTVFRNFSRARTSI